MKQLALPLSWSDLWEQSGYWKDDGRAQSWILDQHPKFKCGSWVTHKSGQTGRIHSVYCGELICSVEFKDDGSTKRSERWHVWDVAAA